MWAFVSLAMSAALLTAAPEVKLRTLDGKTHEGRLTALANDQATLETSSGTEQFPTQQVIAVEPVTAPAAKPKPATAWVQLTDGSQLTVADCLMQDKATLKLLNGTEVTCPAKSVAHVRLQEQDATIAGQWADILKVEAAGDLLVIRKGESIDYLEGVVKQIGAESATFVLDDMDVPVNRARIEGVVYFRPRAGSLPRTVLVFDDQQLGQLEVSSVALNDEGLLELKTPAGLEITRGWDQVRKLDFSLGKLQYLGDPRGVGDLIPESSAWIPYFGRGRESEQILFRPRANRGFKQGDPLRLGGESYARGLWIHSRTELVYRLRGQFRRLVTLAGIDDTMRGKGGHVHLVITGDDKTLFEKDITDQDEPLPLDLDVSGVNRLTILVDFGENSDIADHLVLCDVRVIK